MSLDINVVKAVMRLKMRSRSKSKTSSVDDGNASEDSPELSHFYAGYSDTDDDEGYHTTRSSVSTFGNIISARVSEAFEESPTRSSGFGQARGTKGGIYGSTDSNRSTSQSGRRFSGPSGSGKKGKVPPIPPGQVTSYQRDSLVVLIT
jgi:hypothetical protein